MIYEKIEKLKAIGKRYDISPAKIADLIGVSTQTYWRYRKGITIPRSKSTRIMIDNFIDRYDIIKKL